MSNITEHVFLVAVTIEGPAGLSREQAEYALHAALPKPYGRTLNTTEGEAVVQEWWIAEDDRRDGSDNDSAVFVPFTPWQRTRPTICI